MKGEMMYLKLNRTTASGGMDSEYRRLEDKPLPLACETSPQIIISMLRQLVNVAGVPQECIYVGDAIMLSLDPVAIESVAYDFLRTEFSNPEHSIPHIIAHGVEDYLHQAAVFVFLST